MNRNNHLHAAVQSEGLGFDVDDFAGRLLCHAVDVFRCNLYLAYGEHGDGLRKRRLVLLHLCQALFVQPEIKDDPAAKLEEVFVSALALFHVRRALVEREHLDHRSRVSGSGHFGETFGYHTLLIFLVGSACPSRLQRTDDRESVGDLLVSLVRFCLK